MAQPPGKASQGVRCPLEIPGGMARGPVTIPARSPTPGVPGTRRRPRLSALRDASRSIARCGWREGSCPPRPRPTKCVPRCGTTRRPRGRGAGGLRGTPVGLPQGLSVSRVSSLMCVVSSPSPERRIRLGCQSGRDGPLLIIFAIGAQSVRKNRRESISRQGGRCQSQWRHPCTGGP